VRLKMLSKRQGMTVFSVLVAALVSLIVTTELSLHRVAQEKSRQEETTLAPWHTRRSSISLRAPQNDTTPEPVTTPRTTVSGFDKNPNPLEQRRERIQAERRRRALITSGRSARDENATIMAIMINGSAPQYLRPPLDSLVSSPLNVTGDVQFLLDFAIIGFGKCGTSTMMRWLAAHPQVAAFDHEVWELMQSRPGNLVRLLYLDLPEGEYYKRGYKNPGEITQSHILDYHRTLWPQTKLFVGIRHPVRWFESLYNCKCNSDQSNRRR
jgi:hypothetical protein